MDTGNNQILRNKLGEIDSYVIKGNRNGKTTMFDSQNSPGGKLYETSKPTTLSKSNMVNFELSRRNFFTLYNSPETSSIDNWNKYKVLTKIEKRRNTICYSGKGRSSLTADKTQLDETGRSKNSRLLNRRATVREITFALTDEEAVNAGGKSLFREAQQIEEEEAVNSDKKQNEPERPQLCKKKASKEYLMVESMLLGGNEKAAESNGTVESVTKIQLKTRKPGVFELPELDLCRSVQTSLTTTRDKSAGEQTPRRRRVTVAGCKFPFDSEWANMRTDTARSRYSLQEKSTPRKTSTPNRVQWRI